MKAKTMRMKTRKIWDFKTLRLKKLLRTTNRNKSKNSNRKTKKDKILNKADSKENSKNS